MAEDSLRSAIDAIRTRLHEELEAQLSHLSSRHADEVEAARRAAEADAEQRWAARVDAVRNEWTSRLESEVSTVRAEAERRMVAESMRLRTEADQAAADRAEAVRAELEQTFAAQREELDRTLAAGRLELERALAAEREQRAETERRLAAEREESEQRLTAERKHLSAESEKVQRELTSVRQELETLLGELGQARQALEAMTRQRDGAIRERDDVVERERRVVSELTLERQARQADTVRQQETDAALAEARVAERQAQLAIVERLLTAVRSMDTGRSLSDVLGLLTTSASAEAPRVALLIVNGEELRGWKTTGFSVEASSLHVNVKDAGLLGEAMRKREPVVTGAADGPPPPAFAELPAGRAAIAVPLLVGAQPVAVLYADDAADGTPAAPASWPEAIQVLGSHASVILAHLTAARAAEAMRRSMHPGAAAVGQSNAAPAAGGAEDGNSARRYARLLVSEIKLYNEAAVRLGRQKRDLLERLKPEIERARKLYTQRISPNVDSRAALFQQELVQTLADGDASLLGNPA